MAQWLANGVPEATSVLVLSRYGMDAVLGCGGTLALHAERGIPVTLVILNDRQYLPDGGSGTDQRHPNQEESILAARTLGIGGFEFCHLSESQMEYGETLVERLRLEILNHRAALVYAPSLYESDPGHRSLIMATIEAVRRIGTGVRLAMYEIVTPLQPNFLADISSVADKKQEAGFHFSNVSDHAHTSKIAQALNRFRACCLTDDTTAAEAFEIVDAQELAQEQMTIYASEYQRQNHLGRPMNGSKDLPLVSVIVRSMDRPTLATALDSIAVQTYPNVEVVLVNARGGGHRKMPPCCGRFPLRVVGNGERLRRSRAANVGLEEAAGEYLIFLDDDDWFEPHHLATLKAAFDKAENTVAVYSSVRCVDETGEETQRFAQEFDPTQLRIQNYIPIHACLFHRRVVEAGARFDEDLDLCEDWDFWLLLSKHGPFRFIPTLGAHYRRRRDAGSGVWDNPDATRAVMITIYRKWFPRWNDGQIWSLFEYARYRSIFVESNKRVSLLQQDNAQLQQDVHNIHGSLSWRITAPLRFAGQFGERVRGALPSFRRWRPTKAPALRPKVWSDSQQTNEPKPHKYDYQVTSNTAAAAVVRMVGRGKRVLEIGCGPGSITRVLAQQGQCRVTGLEIDPEAIERVSPFCDGVIRADLNSQDWPQLLEDRGKFEVVVAADVLEHLQDPLATLTRMTQLIDQRGYLVISLPHIAHAAVLASLMDGDFQYRDWGLLDRTHIRFFGLKNMEDLFSKAGLKILAVEYISFPPDQTEFAQKWAALPPTLQSALASSPYASIYQVVTKLVPHHFTGDPLHLVPECEMSGSKEFISARMNPISH